MTMIKSVLGLLGRTAAAPQLTVAATRLYSAAAVDDKIVIEVPAFKAHKIEPPSTKVETSVKELLYMYELMQRMRKMEITADIAYKAKLIRGFCHLYDGQEAIAVGMELAITKADSIITSYRDHCQYLLKGGTVKAVMAELFGRSEGATRGIGGSMHFYSKETNFYGGCGIVGAQIPLGAGLGFAHKYRKDGSVAFAMYGDGAANQGQKYEALNMSALWNLPVIFVCENNHYGMGTAEWRAAKSSAFYTRGDYIPGLKVDGMDALAVKQACAFAKAHAVENGPIILEMDTYRYHGHSMSDPGSTYRTRDEVAGMRQKRDPIEHIKKMLTTAGVDGAEMKKIERETKKEVEAAVEAAKQSPIPPIHWGWRNVYKSPENAPLRDIDGSYRVPVYDPTYAT